MSSEYGGDVLPAFHVPHHTVRSFGPRRIRRLPDPPEPADDACWRVTAERLPDLVGKPVFTSDRLYGGDEADVGATAARGWSKRWRSSPPTAST